MGVKIDSNKCQKKYKDLFDDVETKAAAFDKIAENYYFQNFGTMQKSDLDVLLFSIYIERILEKSEEDMNSYSDYTLSKLLGITQNRISTLKEKKELKYPKEFDIKRAFERVLKNAVYENGKIRVYISDRTLFLELKNIVETNGGIVDLQLNSSILQMTSASFVMLLMGFSETEERKEIEAKLKNILKANEKKELDVKQYIESKTLGENLKTILKNSSGGVLECILDEFAKVSGYSGITKIIKTVLNL